ncbi:hypothetical protein GF386_04630 [Candidatus Pacearchaeota archaeon]|nr:hypothetical protein [Candidatus Pacearchaeota archaeon]
MITFPINMGGVNEVSDLRYLDSVLDCLEKDYSSQEPSIRSFFPDTPSSGVFVGVFANTHGFSGTIDIDLFSLRSCEYGIPFLVRGDCTTPRRFAEAYQRGRLRENYRQIEEVGLLIPDLEGEGITLEEWITGICREYNFRDLIVGKRDEWASVHFLEEELSRLERMMKTEGFMLLNQDN